MYYGLCHFGNWGSLGYFNGGSLGSLSEWGWVGLAVNLVFWIGLLVGLTLLVVRALRRDSDHAVTVPWAGELPTARDILQARYARGEITREQYELLKRDIG